MFKPCPLATPTHHPLIAFECGVRAAGSLAETVNFVNFTSGGRPRAGRSQNDMRASSQPWCGLPCVRRMAFAHHPRHVIVPRHP
jgi:hypothetical protein